MPEPLHTFLEYQAARKVFDQMAERYVIEGLPEAQKREMDELNLRISRFENHEHCHDNKILPL